MSTKEVSFFPIALRYGLIGGMIMIIWTLIAQLLGLNKPSISTAIIAMIVSLGVTIGILVIAMRQLRTEQGHMTLGQGFLLGLVTILIMTVLSSIFTYLYFSFINPAAIDEMMAGMEEMMSKFGMSEDQLAKAMEETRKSMTPTGMVKSTLMNGVIFGAIVSVIVAAIMQKKPNIFPDIVDNTEA